MSTSSITPPASAGAGPRRCSPSPRDRAGASPAAFLVIGAVLAAVTGCGGRYVAGSFEGRQGRFPGSALTVGCLDVAVAAIRDPKATGAVAEIHFGNRCDTRVRVDLGAITATGRYESGHAIRLRVYDPRGEIRAGMLDAGGRGREVLEFQPEPGPMLRLAMAHTVETESADDDDLGAAREPALAALCLDLSELDPDAPSAKPVQTCVDVPQPLDRGHEL